MNVEARGTRPKNMFVSVDIPRVQVIEIFSESAYRLCVGGPRGERWMVEIPQRYCEEVEA